LAKKQGKVLVLTNITQLVTLAGSPGPRRGAALQELNIITDAAVLCSGGKIVAASKQREMLKHPWFKKNKKKIEEFDCGGGVVTPGFVDSHTHLVFAEPRLVDFEKRIAGETYEEIAAAGGGIKSSLAGVRKASKAELASRAEAALYKMLDGGTTTVEAKSGYGLSLESELKSLEAIKAAAKKWPGTLVATLLGAHVVPPEFKDDRAAYVREVTSKMIPQAAKKKLAEYVDVFCERSAFTPEETAKIFAAGRAHGLKLRAHVGQFTPCDLEKLLRHKPDSFDHMDVFRDEDLPRLAKSDTVATLLPAANYFLGHTKYPDARKLISAGVAVALATDYNPGTSPTTSMQFVMSAACTQMKMSPAEVLVASTINGACGLGLGDRKGSIQSGKDADLAVFDIGDYRELPYWIGGNACVGTVANGNLSER
jgi:imidazolonepropionase